MTAAARIRVLSDAMVNQIAAGEVIERPASVVKELVENSLDAGARRVAVEVDAGGREGIRVRDDGSGMGREDALLSIRRHATSKLSTADDLFAITTLGFRGEALASIAEVSRLELRTGLSGDSAGTRVVVDCGRVEAVEDAGNPGGTEVSVRRLFANTPVRLKFLRGDRTESEHIAEAVTRLALSQPDVAFVLRSSGRTLLDLPASGSARERVAAVLGKAVDASLIPVRGASHELVLDGFSSDPSLHRAHAASMHLFVNGRWVRDRALIAAVMQAYRDVLPRGRYPVTALFLDLPPHRVDVNVHPTKVEVRFRDPRVVWTLLVDALAAALRATTSTDRQPSLPVAAGNTLRLDRPAPAGVAPPIAVRHGANAGGPPVLPSPRPVRTPPADPARWEHPLAGPSGGAQVHAVVGGIGVAEQGGALLLVDLRAEATRRCRAALEAAIEGREHAPRLRPLMPEQVDLGEGPARRVEEAAEALSTLGVEISPWGGGTLAVHAYPDPLSRASLPSVLSALSARLPAPQTALADVIASFAAPPSTVAVARPMIEAAIAAGRAARADEIALRTLLRG